MAPDTTLYHKEWLQEDRILCYRLLDLRPSTVDAWAADLTAEFLSAPAEKPWRLLLDIRLHGAVVSAYALFRARQIANMRPELPGRLAILVGGKLSGDIISIAIRSVNRYRQRAVFVNEALAVNWLLEQNRQL
jgi:hypothetical protein